MITSAKLTGIRNVENAEYELGKRTLVIGPNASGKSSIPLAMFLARSGYQPGLDKTLVFDNAGDGRMEAVISDGTQTLSRRWWTKRKGGVSSEVQLGEETATTKKDAEALLNGHFPLFDIEGYYSMSPLEQRRLILSLCGDPDEYEAAKKAYDDANAALQQARKDRKAADATVETLRKQLAEIERPTGNLAVLEKEQAELKAEAHRLRRVIEAGKDADHKNEQRERAVGKLEALRAQSEAALAMIEDAKAQRDKAAQRQTELHEHKPEPPGAGCQLTDEGRNSLQSAVEALYAVGEEYEDLPDRLQAIISYIQSVMSTPEEWEAYDNAHDDWLDAMSENDDELGDANGTIKAKTREVEDLDARIQEGKKFVESLGKEQPGVDPNDVTALEGVKSRLNEVEGQVRILNRIDSIEAQIEQAKATAAEAYEQESGHALDAVEKAREAITDLTNAVQGALSERSQAVLYDGKLVMEDDGRKIHLYYERGGKRISRYTLSGGEQKVFDAALSYALCPEAPVIIEAAELDPQRMHAMTEHVSTQQIGQIIILTCHDVGVMPDGWTVIHTAS